MNLFFKKKSWIGKVPSLCTQAFSFLPEEKASPPATFQMRIGKDFIFLRSIANNVFNNRIKIFFFPDPPLSPTAGDLFAVSLQKKVSPLLVQ